MLSILFLVGFGDSLGNKKYIEGLWIGSYAELDRDQYTSHPYLLDIQKDSFISTVFGASDTSMEKYPWKWAGANLKFDTNTVLQRNFHLDKKELSFGSVYTQVYRKPKSVDLGVNQETIEGILKGNIWETSEGTYHFQADGNCLFQATGQNTYLQFCWSVFNYQSYYFLKINGYPNNCEGYTHFVEQILKVDSKLIQTEKFHDGKLATLNYKKQPATQLNASAASFQKCNQYLYRNYPRHRYYYQGTHYRDGGLYRIRKIFAEQYQNVSDENADGLIRVLFIVNCMGQAGEFEVLELNNNYKKINFNQKVSQQILSICQNLQDWVPAKEDASNRYIDSYKYLSFRIKDGKIIDIFP